jgi:hypothetical protein
MPPQYKQLTWFMLCHLFNICDAVLTLVAMSRGVEEANPIMAWALAISPVFFVAAKFAIFYVALGWIAYKAPGLLMPIGMLFASVIGYHAYYWLLI